MRVAALEQLPEHLRAQVAAKIEREAARAKAPAKKAPKYRAQPVEVDGWRFDSKLEARTYEQLKALRSAGAIEWFTRQVPFHLPGGVRYRADFLVVWKGGAVEVLDSKGVDTRVSTIKRAQVLDIYGIRVRIVDRAVLAKGVAPHAS